MLSFYSTTHTFLCVTGSIGKAATGGSEKCILELTTSSGDCITVAITRRVGVLEKETPTAIHKESREKR